MSPLPHSGVLVSQEPPQSPGEEGGGTTPPSAPSLPQRLRSLDALRGFDMFWIIGGAAIVQGLGKGLGLGLDNPWLEQFEHVRWQGLHFFDVIWPLFMFMVGVSIPLSIVKRKAAGQTSKDIYLHATVRAVLLFVLGMIAQGNLLSFDLSKLHPCYSVLHGIAAGYLIAIAVAVNFKPVWQGAIVALFLLLNWALLTFIPVPGVGPGILTPEGNAAIYIDKLVLGRFQYGENTWFLSYLGFACSVLLGVLAGELLRSERPARIKVYGLFGAGFALIATGLIWSVWFPIIKLLWTSSFVLVGGGLSALLMGAFYLCIDVVGFRGWSFPFVVIGINPLAVYMATMLFDFRNIGNIFVGHLSPFLGRWHDFVEAVAAFAVVWLILYWMYRTKSVVRL